MDDFTSLFFADDEPSAQERAAAMTAALRKQRAGGQLGMLTGDKVLGQFGQGQVQGAQQQEAMLANQGQFRSGQRLTRAMAAQQQGFQGGENAKNRALERELTTAKLTEGMEEAKLKAKGSRVEASSGARKELMNNPVTKAAQEVATSYQRIQRAAAQPSAAGDLSLIFSYMKMLDPGSSVREGEFANAQNAAGVPERLLAQYNKMLSGERLSGDTRADFVNQAKNLYAAQIGEYEKLAEQFRAHAERNGLDPADVVFDLGLKNGGPAATPARISSDDDYAKLPAGAQYVGPDGQVRQKK